MKTIKGFFFFCQARASSDLEFLVHASALPSLKDTLGEDVRGTFFLRL